MQYQELDKIKNMIDLGGAVGGVAQILFYAVIIFFVAALVLLCLCGITLLFIKTGRYLIIHIGAAMEESSQSILAKKITFPLNAGTSKRDKTSVLIAQSGASGREEGM